MRYHIEHWAHRFGILNWLCFWSDELNVFLISSFIIIIHFICCFRLHFKDGCNLFKLIRCSSQGFFYASKFACNLFLSWRKFLLHFQKFSSLFVLSSLHYFQNIYYIFNLFCDRINSSLNPSFPCLNFVWVFTIYQVSILV